MPKERQSMSIVKNDDNANWTDRIILLFCDNFTDLLLKRISRFLVKSGARN